MKQLYANNALSALASGISAASNALAVTAGHGGLFPFIPNGSTDFFYMTLVKKFGGEETQREIVKVTERTGDLFTIVRGQDGTTAQAFDIDDIVEMRVIAQTFRQLNTESLTAESASIAGPAAINSLTLPVTALAVSEGGTGARTSAGARTALDVYSKAEADSKFVDSTGTVTISGDVAGSASFTGDSVNVNVTIQPNSVALGTDTTGNYVALVQGTINRALVTGTPGEAATFTVDVDATSLNTANKVVARDASGNFSAGTITAALSGNATTATTLQTARTINTVSFDGSANIVVEPFVESDETSAAERFITFVDSTTDGHQRLNEDSSLTYNPSTNSLTAANFLGNASTATRLATARTIALSGDVTGSASFDGSANVTIAATIAPDSVALGTDTTGNYLASGAVSGNGLSGSAAAEGATFTVTSNATAANTASTIVFRDASGNFSASTITAALSGNATTATTLQTSRNINGVAFNGSADISITAQTPTSLTFNNGGAGGASGSTFNGGTALTVSYNSVGAPSATGAGASGTWNISITGNAATATTATSATNATNVAVTDDTTTNATYYPSLALGTSGNQARKVSSTKLTFNPSTGTLSSTAFAGNGSAVTALSADNITSGTLANARTTATSANTANAIVSRDATGNFSAGTITAALSGNATTATTLQTARTINGVSFNGSANITITANTTNALTAGTYLTGGTFNGSSAVTFAVDATSTNTASKVVARDASGNFSAGIITAALDGNASTATTATNQSGGTVAATTGSFSGQLTSTVADGTAPFVVTSTTRVANLNVATAGYADVAGSVLGGGGVAGQITVTDDTASVDVHYPIIAAAATGDISPEVSSTKLTFTPSTGLLSATSFAGQGTALTALDASQLATGTVPGGRGVTAGSTATSFVTYAGTTQTAGNFYGGTTVPSGTTRLNYDGNLYATAFIGATQASTLTGAVGSLSGNLGVTSGSTLNSFVSYNGTTSTAGKFYGGTTAPAGTTRLNYSGYLYATQFYGNGANLTSLSAGQLTGTVNANQGVVAGSTSQSFVAYRGTTKTAGSFDGGTVDPSGTTRLNFDGYLYATRFYGDGSQLTNVTATTATNQSGGTVNATTGSFSGQVTSTVANGTAPFVVTSTTRVANLNVASAGTADTATSATSATNATNATNLAVTDDTTTNATYYPTFALGTTGNQAQKVASTKFLFNPSTGTLSASILAGNSLSVQTLATSGNATLGDATTDSHVINGRLESNGPTQQVASAVAALDISLAVSNYFTKTINANSTFTFSNPPATGKAFAFTLRLVHTSGTVTWPTSVTWPENNTAPVLTTGRTHLFTFVTDNAGTTWRGSYLKNYTT